MLNEPKTKILVVDDTPDMATLMSWAMEEKGYQALTAYNGKRALELAAAQRPSAILLDIMMPGMNGIEVLHKLKSDAQLQDIPVILVTAKGENDDVILGLEAGAHDYVTKPFNSEILAARVHSAVRIKQHNDKLTALTKELQVEIAERKRMEQELVRAQKLESIGHLAAGIAHEINTPAQYVGDNTRFLQDIFTTVNVLLGELDMLLDAAKCGKISEELIAKVDANIRDANVEYIKEEVPKAILQTLEGIGRVSNIVMAMKEFANPGNGHKQPVDLNRAIESTLTVSRNEWKYVADLVTDFDSDLPPVPCLIGDFNQVILHLVVNAAQAISNTLDNNANGKGAITVRTHHIGDWAEIRIEDTGCGIPESIRDKIFDQFFTTKEVGKAMGLGLSFAHSIVVTKHRGTISFDTHEGQGTTFIIRLPLVDQTALAQSAQP
jgi:signal transduction histidine kinase